MEIIIDKNTVENLPFKLPFEDIKNMSKKEIHEPIIYDRFKKKAICMNCRKEFAYSFSGSEEELLKANARTIFIMKKWHSGDFIECPLCGKLTNAAPHTSNEMSTVTTIHFWLEENGNNLKYAITSLYYIYKKEIPWEEIPEIPAKLLIYQIGELSRKNQTNWLFYGNRLSETNQVYVNQSVLREYPHIDYDNIAGCIENSYLKHSNIIAKISRFDANCLLKYISLCAEYPQIEYIEKAGLGEIVRGKLYGYPTYVRPNWRAKTIHGFLRLSPQDVDKLKNWNMFYVEMVAFYQNLKKFYQRPTKKQIQTVRKWFDHCSDINYKVDLYRIAKYLLRQYENGKPKCSKGAYGYNYSHVMQIYNDYIDTIKKLDYRLSDYYLYPPDLKAAHDRVATEYREKLDKEHERLNAEKNKKLKKAVEKLEKFKFENEEYIIRPLRTRAEFIAEGRDNHNCVASYFGRCATGKSIVFVVRQTQNPEKSFCTLEVDTDLSCIRQLYGSGNSTPPKEVREFVQWWMKTIIPQVKKESKRTQKKKDADAA